MSIRLYVYMPICLYVHMSICLYILEFERENEVEPNFFLYANKFNVTPDDKIFTENKN